MSTHYVVCGYDRQTSKLALSFDVGADVAEKLTGEKREDISDARPLPGFALYKGSNNVPIGAELEYFLEVSEAPQ